MTRPETQRAIMAVGGRRPLASRRWLPDLARARGSVGRVRLFRGHGAHDLVLVSGHLVEGPDGVLLLSAELAVVPAGRNGLRAAPGASVFFDGRAEDRFNVNRFRLHGVLTVGQQRGPAEFELHDLGWSSDPRAGKRRFLDISGVLDGRTWNCDALPGGRFPAARELRVHLHTEWLPESEPPPAA